MQDLRDILGNLLYKACQWAERRVEIQLVSSERHILVVIEDDGLGMTADNAAEEMPEQSSTVPGVQLKVVDALSAEAAKAANPCGKFCRFEFAG